MASPFATSTITIPTWANGPDGSGNGGWSAGLLAELMGDASGGIAVDLRTPPPIGRPLIVATGEDDALDLLDRSDDPEQLIATARRAQVDVDVPDEVVALDVASARAARTGFPFRNEHPFPRCICCGIARSADEPSLDLHCGPVDGMFATDADGAHAPVFADTWTPSADLADPTAPDVVTAAAIWSALDCPSATPFAAIDEIGPAVLARIAVRIDERPLVGDTYVVAAWQRRIDGRKLSSVSALIHPSDRVLAVASALWIELRR